MSDLVERLRKYAPAATKPTVAALMDEAAAHIEPLQAELAEARAKVEAVINAVQAYLPPDGIGKDEFVSRVIAAVDTPLKERGRDE
jgi:hypothetical protein